MSTLSSQTVPEQAELAAGSLGAASCSMPKQHDQKK
jgi:hypothetical protein